MREPVTTISSVEVVVVVCAEADVASAISDNVATELKRAVRRIERPAKLRFIISPLDPREPGCRIDWAPDEPTEGSAEDGSTRAGFGRGARRKPVAARHRHCVAEAVLGLP
ncbi:hypothetical protein TMPK1_22390 [Rhodospirillales bacterium TMPK1]|uniref:Uncharacterized protein n=1 Tax=Roseiterribacter gracilis TaxID=2812848 RepID=A0A8S8XD72_9PROT|nr:hypothetical protein TMPK1_22390 [Rhodospirillales bacterium TMPK1]